MPKQSKDNKMVEPSDEMLVAEIKAKRLDNPAMGREKLMGKVRRENKTWEFTGARFKKILVEYDLDAEETKKLRAEKAFKPRDNAFKASIKPAFEEYRERERAFLLTLSEKDRRTLDQKKPKPLSKNHLRLLERINGKPLSKNDPRLRYGLQQQKSRTPKWFFAAHSRFHVQVLMTLSGLKSATLFSHPKFSGNAVLERMVEQCLKPVMIKYKLENYGFTLQKIEHPMRTQSGSSFQGAMVFANMRNADPVVTEDIQAVFFTFHSRTAFSEGSLAKVLGYPMAGRPGMGVVQYRDLTEMKLLWEAIEKDSGNSAAQFFVPGLEYYCGSGVEYFQPSMRHFEAWAKIANHFGVALKHDSSTLKEFNSFKEKKASGRK